MTRMQSTHALVIREYDSMSFMGEISQCILANPSEWAWNFIEAALNCAAMRRNYFDSLTAISVPKVRRGFAASVRNSVFGPQLHQRMFTVFAPLVEWDNESTEEQREHERELICNGTVLPMVLFAQLLANDMMTHDGAINMEIAEMCLNLHHSSFMKIREETQKGLAVDIKEALILFRAQIDTLSRDEHKDFVTSVLRHALKFETLSTWYEAWRERQGGSPAIPPPMMVSEETIWEFLDVTLQKKKKSEKEIMAAFLPRSAAIQT